MQAVGGVRGTHPMGVGTQVGGLGARLSPVLDNQVTSDSSVVSDTLLVAQDAPQIIYLDLGISCPNPTC